MGSHVFQRVLFGMAAAALVAALVYAWRHERSVPASTTWTSGSGSGSGSAAGSAATPDGGVVDAAPGDAAGTDAPGDGPQTPTQLRARVTIGDTRTDVVVVGDGDAARPLCDEIVAHELRTRVENLKPALARGCDSRELPAIARQPGSYVLIDSRKVAAADFLPVIVGKTTATATIENVSRFATATGCEQARQRLVAARQQGSGQASAAATAALTREVEGARRDAARECDVAKTTPESCASAKRKIELLERSLSHRTNDTPPSIPACQAE